MAHLDLTLFHWINRWPDVLSPCFVFLSDGIKQWPLRIFLGLLVVAMLSRPGRPRRTVIHALIAWPLADGLTHLLKNHLPDARPCVSLPDVVLRTGFLSSSGTASAHSANMAAIATVWVIMLGPRWGAIWIAVALATGLSRIYVGVHFPSQVLLGWICGIFVGWSVVSLSRKIFRQPQTVAIDDDGDEPEIP